MKTTMQAMAVAVLVMMLMSALHVATAHDFARGDDVVDFVGPGFRYLHSERTETSFTLEFEGPRQYRLPSGEIDPAQRWRYLIEGVPWRHCDRRTPWIAISTGRYTCTLPASYGQREFALRVRMQHHHGDVAYTKTSGSSYPQVRLSPPSNPPPPEPDPGPGSPITIKAGERPDGRFDVVVSWDPPAFDYSDRPDLIGSCSVSIGDVGGFDGGGSGCLNRNSTVLGFVRRLERGVKYTVTAYCAEAIPVIFEDITPSCSSKGRRVLARQRKEFTPGEDGGSPETPSPPEPEPPESCPAASPFGKRWLVPLFGDTAKLRVTNREGDTSIDICAYDVNGDRVACLLNQALDAHEIGRWDRSSFPEHDVVGPWSLRIRARVSEGGCGVFVTVLTKPGGGGITLLPAVRTDR